MRTPPLGLKQLFRTIRQKPLLRPFQARPAGKRLPFFAPTLALLIAGWGFVGPVFAQTPLLSSNTPAAFSLIHGSYGNGSIVSVSGQPFTQAWQVNVTGTAPSSESVVLTANTVASVNAGDVMVATFYYRRTDTAADEINITACFQQVASPGNKSVTLPLRGRQQWRVVSIPFIADASYATGGARFYFQLSAQIQSLQISGVALSNYGQKSLFGPGITDATPLFSFMGSAAGTTFGTLSSVSVTGNPFFTTASHISVIADPHVDSYVKLIANVPGTVTLGDTLVAIFWARDADTPTKNAIVGLTAQQSVYPNAIVYNQGTILVDGTWKQHIIPFTANASYSGNAMQFLVKCAAQLQTVEFAGLQLVNLGTSASVASLTSTVNDYPGRALSDSWRTDANTRIAANRKGNFALTVTGASGSALSGVTVTAAMQKHLFGFGSAVQANELTKVTGTDADNYRATVKTLFNKVTFENEMKWQQWETTSGTKTVQDAIGWLRTNGITNIRGHNLVWPSWGYCPSDLPTLSITDLTNRVLNHIDNESQCFKIKNYMKDWDVVNEPYVNHSVIDKINGITSGRGTVTQDASVINTWFARTGTDDAYPTRFLNDANVVENALHLNNDRENYNYNLLSALTASGTWVQGFGFESHFTTATGATPPLLAKSIFDRFTALGIKGQVTEFDHDTPDQILQADFLADYMTMVFSLPNFDTFMMWGFWDTKSWVNNAPLYTATWALKPSGEAWKGLVFGKWWTNASATTNGSGAATVNGFLGRYALTGTSGGITKIYYANLPSPSGAQLNLKVSGTAGTTHVWLHEPAQAPLYSPFTVSSDPNAYGGTYVTSGTGTGNTSSATSGLIRVDTEASGVVNIWLRVIAPNSSSDSFWLSVNGETFQNFTLAQGSSWHWVFWKQANLPAATTNCIYVTDAEGGTGLNQVLITDDLTFSP